MATRRRLDEKVPVKHDTRDGRAPESIRARDRALNRDRFGIDSDLRPSESDRPEDHEHDYDHEHERIRLAPLGKGMVEASGYAPDFAALQAAAITRFA